MLETIRPLAAIASRPGGLWLHSSSVEASAGSWNAVSCEPALWLRGAGNLLEILPGPAGDRGWLARIHALDPGPGLAFDRIAAIARRLRHHPSPIAPKHLAWTGGLAGSFSYDLGRRFEAIPQRLPPLSPWDFQLGLYDEVLLFDPSQGQVTYQRLPESGVPRLLGLWEEAKQAKSTASNADFKSWKGLPDPPQPEWDKETHCNAVSDIKEAIRAGTIYQANLTLRFSAPCQDKAAPITTFLRLLDSNPAPFAAYFDLPAQAIVSVSPECFLQVDRNGAVLSRPIKGTAARSGAGPAQDEKERQTLLESEKDRSELNMIVDLVRNDLGRVCALGSVPTSIPLETEAHPGLWHLAASVRGKLAQRRDAFDLFRAAFPPGSCIGAPKIQAMAEIEAIERSRRGPYTGALGWIGFDGAMSLSVAIRSLEFSRGELRYGVGGGIVYDSEPLAEWSEALLKGQALAKAVTQPHQSKASQDLPLTWPHARPR